MIRALPILSLVRLGLFLAAGVSGPMLRAANVNLTAHDALNSSSFNAAGNWSNAAAPSAANDYFTGAFTLRSLPSGGATFAGNSLTLSAGGVFAMKSTSLHTIPNFILDGGQINNSGLGGSGAETGLIGGGMTLNTTSTFQVGGGGGSNLRHLNISATIGGAAGLTINKIGGLTGEAVTLSGSGANTYAGLTTVQNGARLILAKTAGVSAVGGDIVVNNASRLTRNAANQIPDGATVTINGTSILDGTTAETFAALTINSSAANILSGLDISGATAITAGTAHDINSGFAFSTGSLSLTSSNLRLGANSGSTTVNIGAGGLTLNNGVLQLGQTGGASTALVVLGGNVTGSGSSQISRPNSNGPRLLDLDGGTRTFNISSGTTLVGADIQNGGIIKSGAGVLGFSGNNSYSGNTVINASSGTVRVGIGTATGDLGTGTVSVGSGSTIMFRRTNTINVPNDISGAGNLRIGWAGATGPVTGQIVEFAGDNSGFTGNVFIHEGGVRIFDSNGLGDTSISKNIQIVEDGGSNKGRPHLLLNSIGPAIVLPSNFSFTLSNNHTGVAPGTIVNEVGNNVIHGNLDLVGGGGDSRLAAQGGNIDFFGTITAANSVGRTLFLAGPATGSLNGVLQDGVGVFTLRKEGSGTWTLSHPNNTYTGKTQLGVGTSVGPVVITSGSENSLGANPVSYVADQLSLNGGTLQISSADLTINDGNRGITLGTSGGTFEVDGGRVLSIDNTINGGVGQLNKSGAGTLDLTGGNSVVGSYAVHAGTLRLSGGTLNTPTGLVAPGATYELAGGRLRVDAFTVSGNFAWGNGGRLTHFTTGTSLPMAADLSSAGFQEVGVGRTATVTGNLSSGDGAILALNNSPTLYQSFGIRYNNFHVAGALALAGLNDELELELNPYLLRPFSTLGPLAEEYGSLPLLTWTGAWDGNTFDLVSGIADDGRGFSLSTFAVSSGSALDVNTYFLEYDGANQTLWFHYKVSGYVPEPDTFALLALSVLGLRTARTLRQQRARLLVAS